MNTNLIGNTENENTANENESNEEFQAYKAFDQHQNRTKAISKSKGNKNNNRSKGNKNNNRSAKKGTKKSKNNSKPVKNVSKIKEKQTDNRRTQASKYKSKILINYYSPVEDSNIQNDDNDIMYKIYEETYATEAVMDKLYYERFSINELDFINYMDIDMVNRKYYKTDKRYNCTYGNIHNMFK